ncbi:hypothetical protein ES703_60892 [subsurface metagenome]
MTWGDVGAFFAVLVVGRRWGGKGVRVAGCPIGQEWCYPSCYWRKGKRCYFKDKWGRWIPELKKRRG